MRFNCASSATTTNRGLTVILFLQQSRAHTVTTCESTCFPCNSYSRFRLNDTTWKLSWNETRVVNSLVSLSCWKLERRHSLSLPYAPFHVGLKQSDAVLNRQVNYRNTADCTHGHWRWTNERWLAAIKTRRTRFKHPLCPLCAWYS